MLRNAAPASPSHLPVLAIPSGSGRHLLNAILIVVASALLAAGMTDYPLGSGRLIWAIMIYAGLVIAIPRAPLVALPALLPVLDLAPLTGRFFLDEFDLLLLTTLILAHCRSPASSSGRLQFARPGAWLLALFMLSATIAAVMGMRPFAWPDFNAFNNYYSPFNGMRAAKGLLFAVLLIPALKRELDRDAAGTYRLFGLGMTLGVAALAAVVFRERMAFTGLFNFGSGYRVVGAFSAMHNGGACIEAYLVLALPFVAWFALVQKRWLPRLFGLVVFMCGSYCMMVTYARGGYVALLFGMLAFAAAIPLMKSIVLKPVQAGILAALFVLLASVAIPVLQGSYMKGRLSTAQRDLGTRAAHWMQALNMMNTEPQTTLFGIGSGRYPALSEMGARSGFRPSAYRFGSDRYNTWLQLTPGLPLYFEQVVSVKPKQTYRITFSARSTSDDAVLGLPLCEKWLLYSATCISESVVIGDTQGRWKQFEFDLDSTEFGRRPWYASRPIKLALFNQGAASIDVDNVSMTSGGYELIRNGGFDRRMDHWLFSTDRFETWHFENTWLQLYFEQGAVGLLLFVLLVGYTTWFSRSRLQDADFPLPPLGGAMLGFLALGILDSLFDFPRLTLLFFMALAFILIAPQRRTT